MCTLFLFVHIQPACTCYFYILLMSVNSSHLMTNAAYMCLISCNTNFTITTLIVNPAFCHLQVHDKRDSELEYRWDFAKCFVATLVIPAIKPLSHHQLYIIGVHMVHMLLKLMTTMTNFTCIIETVLGSLTVKLKVYS